jgi:D-alanyl-D-alanine carboxypeptidase/D-alanyl-D-alanine-endopeptidase (penicillin-binding protein 4)
MGCMKGCRVRKGWYIYCMSPRPFLCSCLFLLLLSSCSVQRSRRAPAPAADTVLQALLTDPALQEAHVGIAVYEAATGRYLHQYQADKYFVPASNTKIATCYAAMKYLGDSIKGLRYSFPEERGYRFVAIQPTGDPTFLLEEFSRQPVAHFLAEQTAKGLNIGILDTAWRDQHWGSGWSWNDYDAAYMAERSAFPIYGNVLTVFANDSARRIFKDTVYPYATQYRPFRSSLPFFDSLLNGRPWPREELLKKGHYRTTRALASNAFRTEPAATPLTRQALPFVTNGSATARALLSSRYGRGVYSLLPNGKPNEYVYDQPDSDVSIVHLNTWHTLYSQATDSLLKPLMHRSDNFFAEQALLMVSNERLGQMSAARVIDTLLMMDFAGLRLRWVDGSGLSRYNLFTPQALVGILERMQKSFGMARISEIFPSANEGTLSNYYRGLEGKFFAKTGTLSGVVALSGFMYGKDNRLLLFSVLVNNHNGSATAVRRAVERYLLAVREGRAG